MEVDLARALASHVFAGSTDLARRLDLVDLAPEERVPALLSGSVDCVVGGLTVSHEHSRLIDFSDGYLRAGRVLAARPGAEDACMLPGALAGQRVAIVAGTTARATLNDLAFGVVPVELPRLADCVEAVLGGKIDLLWAIAPLLRAYLRSEGAELWVDPVERALETWAIGVPQQDRAMRDVVNDVLRSLRRSGRLDAMREHWVAPAVVQLP